MFAEFQGLQLSEYHNNMAVTPLPGYIVDPTNPNGVVKLDSVMPPASTTLQQDQAKALNQGKPGYDVLGNAVTTPPATTKTPTTISGDMSSTISDNTQKTNDINTSITNNKTAQFTGGLEQYNDGTSISAPNDAVMQGDDNGNTWWTSGGKNYATGPDQGISPEVKQSQDLLQQIKTQTDASFAAQISAVQAQFNSLINQQKDVNSRQEASVSQTLLAGGTSRYAGINASGLNTAQISYGISQISDLVQKENSAVAALNAAQADKDYELADKQLTILAGIKKDKQTVLKDLNDKLLQANKDVKAAKLAADKVTYDTITKPIQDIALDAKKNGASDAIIGAISGAKDVNGAIAAAGSSLQTATGTLGDYLQYKRDTESQGLVPKDYTTFKDEQDKKAAQNEINKSVAIHNAERQSDADYTASDKVQQKLEQQYRTVLQKEFSSRTGALGVENAKVNQANHLDSLITQYYDSKTGKYNVPKAQYSELVMGLANMISPTGTADVATRKDLNALTAKGDLNGALQYLTGDPQNGNTQAMIKNLIDSVDRQAQTATQNRETALQNLRDQAPTDLEQSRIDALNKSTEMVPYSGQNRISKANVDDYVKENPADAETVAKLYEVPGATDKDIEDYLRAQGKL